RTRCAPRKRPRTLAPNSSNWRARWPRAMASASATRMRSTAWPVRSSSRKSSTAEVFRPARQPSDVLVDPALALEAEEAGVLVLHARLPALGGVEVADGDVALVPQRVVGKVVLLQVLPHVAVVPVGDRADLQAVAAPLQDRGVRAGGRLAAAQAGEPGAGTQFLQCAPHRLDLAQLVVVVQALHALLPQAPVTRFHPCAADQRAVDLEVELQALAQLVGEAVGL